MNDFIVEAEMEAVSLYNWDRDINPHIAGNKIIELAERIKAQRATAAMVLSSDTGTDQ